MVRTEALTPDQPEGFATPGSAAPQAAAAFAQPAAVQLHPMKLDPQTQTLGPWSHSFSRSYGAILPTSLTYIILLTRGFEPWRPDAEIGTV